MEEKPSDQMETIKENPKILVVGDRVHIEDGRRYFKPIEERDILDVEYLETEKGPEKLFWEIRFSDYAGVIFPMLNEQTLETMGLRMEPTALAQIGEERDWRGAYWCSIAKEFEVGEYKPFGYLIGKRKLLGLSNKRDPVRFKMGTEEAERAIEENRRLKSKIAKAFAIPLEEADFDEDIVVDHVIPNANFPEIQGDYKLIQVLIDRELYIQFSTKRLTSSSSPEGHNSLLEDILEKKRKKYERELPFVPNQQGDGYILIGGGWAYIDTLRQRAVFYGSSTGYNIGIDMSEIELLRKKLPKWDFRFDPIADNPKSY